MVDIEKLLERTINTYQQLEKCKETLKRVLQSLQARSKTTPGLGAPINIIKTTLIEIEEYESVHN